MRATPRLLLLIFVSLVCLPTMAPAQPDAAEVVRGFYVKYLQRQPTRKEVRDWATVLQRGETPAYVQGLFLASDEYFRLHGNDPQAWVTAAFKELVGRAPAPEEINSLLAQAGGVSREQRIRLIQLIQAGPPQPALPPPPSVQPPAPVPPAPVPPPPVQPPPVQAPPANGGRLADRAARLVSTAQQLGAAAKLDLARSREGRRLIDRGNDLIAISERFRQTCAGEATVGQRRQAFREVERAFQAVQDELAAAPREMPNATLYAEAFARQLARLRDAGGR